MEARNAGQQSLIRSVEQALSIDASNTQISVNTQLIVGITELLINKGILSKEEIVSMVEAKKGILISRYTDNENRFEKTGTMDLYYSMIAETETLFDNYKKELEKI